MLPIAILRKIVLKIYLTKYRSQAPGASSCAAAAALESLGVELARATGRKLRLHWNVLEGARHVAEVDLAWPELRIGVQFDGWKHHGTRAAFVRDRACDRQLVKLGWTVLRFPWDDVVRKPDTVVEELVQILSRATNV